MIDPVKRIENAERELELAKIELKNHQSQYYENTDFRAIREIFNLPDYTIESIGYNFYNDIILVLTGVRLTYGGYNTLPRLYKAGFHPVRFDFREKDKYTITLSKN